MKRSARWVAIAVAAVVAGSVLSVSTGVVAPKVAGASHVRAAQLTWERVDADTASFHVTVSTRASYLGWGDLGVGGTFTLDGDLDFGDGTVVSPEVTIVHLDLTNDYLVAETTIVKDYTGSGPFTAALASCCRLELSGGHMNNGGFSPAWRVQTTVDLTVVRSPRATISPIVDCPIDEECSFTVGAIAPSGTSLRYRFAEGAEAGDGGSGLPFTQPPGATLDPTTGRYTWDTTGVELHPSAPSTFYSTQVVVEALNGGGSVVGSSAVDFFIRLGSGSTNNQPHFHAPTPEDGATIDAQVGVPVTFEVQAEDDDAGDTVTPGILGLPAGATFDVTPGNPALATFSWTPTATGTVVVILTAQDQQGLGAVARSVSIEVGDDAPASPLVVSLAPATSSGDTGTSHTVTATVTRDGAPQAGHLVGFWLVSGPNVGTGGPGTTNGAGQATFTYQGDTAGTDSLIATVDDGGTIRTSNSVTRTWTEPPASGALEVGAESAPDVVTAGAALLRTITVTNTGAAPVDAVTVTFTVPPGGTLVFSDPSQGTCGTLTGGTVTCLLGTLPGDGTATVRIAIGTPSLLPPGSTFSVPATVTAEGEPPVTSDDPPTPVQPPVPGEAHGFVPPGGTLRTGTVATPEDNTIASFTLPNTGPGAVISITSEPCAPGVCFGKTMTFSPFEGYDDPRNPAVFSITWDRTVRGTGLFSQAYVLKENETEFRKVPPCRRPPVRQRQWDHRHRKWFWTWVWFHHHHQPTYWDWLLGGRTGYASPSPCVNVKTFIAGGDLRFDTLFLSGDPSMRRR